MLISFFFFNDTTTTEIYTLSLHDALPISIQRFNDSNHGPVMSNQVVKPGCDLAQGTMFNGLDEFSKNVSRSEEHTSELQSHHDLVCRLLLEKKKKKKKKQTNTTLLIYTRY